MAGKGLHCTHGQNESSPVQVPENHEKEKEKVAKNV